MILKTKNFLVFAKLLDPRYKDKIFSSGSTHEFGKGLLLIEYLHIKQEIEVPYRGKLWWGKTLANLAKDHKFAKV